MANGTRLFSRLSQLQPQDCQSQILLSSTWLMLMKSSGSSLAQFVSLKKFKQEDK